MEVEVVRVVQEVPGHYMVSQDNSLPFLGGMFELLVIVVDDLRYGTMVVFYYI